MDELNDRPERYWHCHVELVGDGKKKDRSAVFNDLTFDELNQQIVNPWHSGRAFTVDGMIVRNINDIQKTEVSRF